MKAETLVRAGGIAMIPGAILACAGLMAQTLHTQEAAGGGAEMLGGIVLVLALPVLTGRLAVYAGRLGLAGGILVTLVVLDFQVIGGALDAFIRPFLAASHVSNLKMPTGLGLLFLAGTLFEVVSLALLAFATLRRHALPAPAGWCWAAALLTAVGGFAPVGGAVFDTLGAAFAYAGLVIAGWALAAVRTPHAERVKAPAFQ